MESALWAIHATAGAVPLTEPERPGMRLGVPHGPLARLKDLDVFFPSYQLVKGRQACRRDWQLKALLAWGQKPSGRWACREAKRRGLPLWRCEDGFLRSVGAGAEEPPLGLVLDQRGIYYDPRQPSQLDALIPQTLDGVQRERARALVQYWRQARLSKYNGARESPIPQEPFVLVVDQCQGDLSLRWARGTVAAFVQALRAALEHHPGHRVVVKIHPDVVAGRRRGHFRPHLLDDARVVVCADGGHPTALLEQAEAVYVVTSQLGFEALLWNKPVYCFGQPFYAGWGLTHDRCVQPAWRESRASVEQMAHACLVAYSRYCDPVTGLPASVEALMEHLALQRQMLMRQPPLLVACGLTPWKQGQARRFLRGPQGSRLWFRPRWWRHWPAAAKAVVWGRPRRAFPVPCWSLEDGFVRSVGLGAALVPPVSWVVDQRGMYYDATQSSDLEVFLASHCFSDEERQRGRQLREQLLAAGLTKYNLAAPVWRRPEAASGRPVRLVVGQVPEDASLRFGLPADATVRSNAKLLAAVRQAHPQDYLLYKPHPDVVAGLRRGEAHERQGIVHGQELADETVLSAEMADLLEVVDSVHVLTSLSGFEALLRQTPVQVFGLPFYAGWGLTQDELGCSRRGRRLHLDELVYSALIHYPRYVCQRSGAWITPEQAVAQLQRMRAHPSVRSLQQQLWRRGRAWWIRLSSGHLRG